MSTVKLVGATSLIPLYLPLIMASLVNLMVYDPSLPQTRPSA